MRIEIQRQLGEQHIFRLKAARQARIVIAGDYTRQSRAHIIELGFYLRIDFNCAHRLLPFRLC
jgi:hypothetical protein